MGDEIKLVTNGSTATSSTRSSSASSSSPTAGTLAGATLTAFDTETAQNLFLDGRDEFNDIWVTAEDGVTRRTSCSDAAAKVLPAPPTRSTGTQVADGQRGRGHR